MIIKNIKIFLISWTLLTHLVNAQEKVIYDSYDDSLPSIRESYNTKSVKIERLIVESKAKITLIESELIKARSDAQGAETVLIASGIMSAILVLTARKLLISKALISKLTYFIGGASITAGGGNYYINIEEVDHLIAILGEEKKNISNYEVEISKNLESLYDVYDEDEDIE